MDNRLIWICISIIHMDFMWTFVFSIRAHGENCVISAYVWQQFGLMYISVTCGCCMRLLINQWNYSLKWCKMWIWCDINFNSHCKKNKLDRSSIQGKEVIWSLCDFRWILVFNMGAYGELCDVILFFKLLYHIHEIR